MSNYLIEDEIGEYSVPQKTKRKFNINGFKIGLIALILLVVIIVVFRISKSSSTTSSYEKQMVDLAKSYVINNNINSSREIYIDASKLNMDLPNNCSLLSGVIYDGINYTPYLLCDNYQSNIINNPKELKLRGNEVMFLLKGMNYYELGYEGNNDVSISSTLIKDPGVYNIYYIPKNSLYVTIRKVIVIDNQNISSYFPKINISDENPIKILKGNKYNEVVTASDIIDGDLTNRILKISNVDESTIGEYKVIYSVCNSFGYTSTIAKDVLVVDSEKENKEPNVLISLSEENITNKSILANVKIVGNNYSFTKLPDGSETRELEFNYPINENGRYEFLVVLSDGSEVLKSINVTNIDKTIPEGKCTATLSNDKTSISVNISSFNYIVGYNYYINGKESNYITSNTYNSVGFKGQANIYVIVKDYIGNEGKINCSITDKRNSLEPDGIRTLVNSKNRLRIPISQALANKGYTVNDLNMCIYNRVKEAGPYTRYGVAAAAFGLIDCTYSMTGYVLSYNHISGKVEGERMCTYNSDICGKLGINRLWGEPGGNCNTDTTVKCWHGLNCATFVRWAMCNGGMDLCTKGSAAAQAMASTTYFPEADGVYVKNGSVTYYSGRNLTKYSANDLVRMLKPGDVVASTEKEGHTFVVVGRDNDGIYTAEDGYYMRHISYRTLISSGEKYRLLFLDNYYANSANRNNLYG